jgi:hypothetical protein
MMITASIRFGAWEGPAYFHEHRWWTAPRPICEFLGLSWPRQRKQILASEGLTCVALRATQVSGQAREILAIPTADIGLWLIQISPRNVSDEARPALIDMQRNLRAAIEKQINEGFGLPAPADIGDLMTAAIPPGLEVLAPAIHEQRASLLAEPGVARAALMFKLGLPGTKTGALLGRSAYWANKRRKLLEAVFVLEPRRPVLGAPANDLAQADLFGQETPDAQ